MLKVFIEKTPLSGHDGFYLPFLHHTKSGARLQGQKGRAILKRRMNLNLGEIIMNRILPIWLALCLLAGCMAAPAAPEAPALADQAASSPQSTAELALQPAFSPSMEAMATPSAVPTPLASAAPSPSPTQAPGAAKEPAPSPSPSKKSEDKLPLAGIRIGLDPGHQIKANRSMEPVAPGSAEMKHAVSSGTEGRWSRTPEYEITLLVGLALRDALEAQGATVYMTRETNEVDIPNTKRAEMMNELGVDLVLRIHCDGNEDSSVHGSSMLIPNNECTKAINAESKRAGEIIQKAFIEATGRKDRGLRKREDMTGCNWSAVPVVLSEMVFMTNEEDDELINTEAFRALCVKGLCQGVLDYFAQKGEGA
jgi:N-acetylmuramoyl-L-alanine amidase